MIGKCYPRHRAVEFKKFLTEIEANVPDDMDVHLIMDNYATHKTDAIRKWLAPRPHWHVHFTPTSASWLNMVEHFFAEISEKQIKRGAHTSVSDLEADILHYIQNRNNDPTPFKWVKSANQILDSVKRFCQKMTQPILRETHDSQH